VIKLSEFDFVAWLQFAPGISVNDIEAAWKTILPEVEFSPVQRDELGMWQFEGHGITFEVQPTAKYSDEAEHRDESYICMVAGYGKTPLEDSSAVVAKMLQSELRMRGWQLTDAFVTAA
jgi:hypothetical protein